MPASLLTDARVPAYEAWVRSHPCGSPFQSLSWKRYQESLGREVRIYVDEEYGAFAASALIVIDRTAFGLSTWDCPRGPLWTRHETRDMRLESLLLSVIHDAEEKHCLSLYLSPLTPITTHISSLKSQVSRRHEQPSATIVLDLTLSEDALLAGMHPKGRYNIRLASKHGIEVRATDTTSLPDDLESFYTLLQETGERNHFTIHPKRFYEAFLQNLDGSFLLIARYQKTPIAGLMGVIWNNTGTYSYGASSYEHRALMSPSLLQWEAIRLCKAKGCTRYDLLGIAPRSREHALPATGSESWSGLSDFKRKFGGRVVEYPPEQEIVLKPMLGKLLRMKRTLLG